MNEYAVKALDATTWDAGFFVDRDYRRQGVAAVAATRSLFEQAGFAYDRPKGRFNCVMRKAVS